MLANNLAEFKVGLSLYTNIFWSFWKFFVKFITIQLIKQNKNTHEIHFATQNILMYLQ